MILLSSHKLLWAMTPNSIIIGRVTAINLSVRVLVFEFRMEWCTTMIFFLEVSTAIKSVLHGTFAMLLFMTKYFLV
jgi:hypothetical protein